MMENLGIHWEPSVHINQFIFNFQYFIVKKESEHLHSSKIIQIKYNFTIVRARLWILIPIFDTMEIPRQIVHLYIIL